ncbi:RICIN domain-containing protein [Micromonospora orduensis]|uniref:RICIN domain-containing protein n=1 Tax=Micromonospora orduensis TaxID=1420891 RepID=A0A5C4QZG0_9ACTN|nr:RICIN domain-containing protein [Micromonospora orduensis]TNH31422.1 RICIN domain-containing protein [Micromonospora orduensis]
MRLRGILAAALIGAAMPALTLAPTPAAAVTAGPFWWASASVSDSNRMVLDVQGPSTAQYAKIHLWSFHGGSSQYWYMDSAGSGSSTWLLRNKYSGKCMDRQGTGTANGTAVVQDTCDFGDKGQQWRQEFRYEGGGHQYYRFVNVLTGKCLDNAEGGITNGNKSKSGAAALPTA